MLLLRAARASPAMAAVVRCKPTRLTPIAGLSSSSGGGRRKKAGRRGEAKPPPPPPPPPPPRLRGDETKKKKKPDVRTAAEAAQGLQRHEVERRKKQPPPPKQEKAKRVVRWKCAAGCGACCKLDKGPDFPSPEEIFAEHPEDLKLYKSMIGADGWCINYDKSTRTCNIYEERPVFCRVEPKVFEEYFGVPSRPSTFDREACSACVDTIKMVYGEESAELTNFKRVIREESKKHEASLNQENFLDT